MSQNSKMMTIFEIFLAVDLLFVVKCRNILNLYFFNICFYNVFDKNVYEQKKQISKVNVYLVNKKWNILPKRHDQLQLMLKKTIISLTTKKIYVFLKIIFEIFHFDNWHNYGKNKREQKMKIKYVYCLNCFEYHVTHSGLNFLKSLFNKICTVVPREPANRLFFLIVV